MGCVNARAETGRFPNGFEESPKHEIEPASSGW
jgi:hypothetical protein